MLITKTHPTLGRVAIVVRQQTEARLAKTCFRGQPVNRAGNFLQWGDTYNLFRDDFVVESLFADAAEALTQSCATNSTCIECQFCTGWSGTDERGKYDSADLERFEPNRRSWALRVNLALGVRLPAPRTNLLTIVYEVKREPGQLALIIHSLYPGKDIGELVGNITERENCVFFDWEHPGLM